MGRGRSTIPVGGDPPGKGFALGAGETYPAVRIATHLHGGVIRPEDDGYPSAWVSPEMDGDEKITGPHSTAPYTGTKEYPADRTLHFTDHLTFSGAPEPSKPNNATNTDTVLVNPQEVVRVRPAFTRFAGQSV